MSNTAIWVLIAGESDAAIWASENGASRLLRVIKQDDVQEGSAAFAWELMAVLLRGAEDGRTDGIIVIASEDMLEQLGRVTVPQVKRLLVAQIPGAPATIAAIPKSPAQMTVWGTVQ